MFGDHFYHATLRKSVAVFGTIFNNIGIVRKKSDGSVINQVKVPLAYGPKQKFLARLDADTMNDASFAIKLPRMSFEITGLEQDLTSKLNKRAQISENHASDSTRKKTVKQQTTYSIGMQLNVMAKNQDDGLQIIEQILPYFQPEYTVTIKPIDGWTTYKEDVPITLISVAINDEYEGDFASRRVLTYTLDFTMKMRFFGPTQNQSVIKEIDIDFFDKDNTGQFLEGINLAVNPKTANESDNHTITTTYDYLNVPDSFVLSLSDISDTFIIGETITGTSSASTAEITAISGSTITVDTTTGYFFEDETITGSAADVTATISSYT